MGHVQFFFPAVRTGSSNTHFFCLVVTCPRPPVFARQKRYSSCLSLHNQGLFNILSDRNIFYTPGGGGGGRTTAGSNAPGAFLVFFFLVITCPRPPLFARPNKYSSCLSLHRQGLLSWVTVTYFTPPGGGGRTTAGSNAPGAFLVFLRIQIRRLFFWWFQK